MKYTKLVKHKEKDLSQAKRKEADAEDDIRNDEFDTPST